MRRAVAASVACLLVTALVGCGPSRAVATAMSGGTAAAPAEDVLAPGVVLSGEAGRWATAAIPGIFAESRVPGVAGPAPADSAVPSSGVSAGPGAKGPHPGPTRPASSTSAQVSEEPSPKTDLAPGAASAVLMDAASGQVLWAKNPNARRPVASVTKLMTMAVVLDALQSGRIRWNDLVSASEQAVRTPGAQIWLELGENMTVKDLFYAVAVQSANDAAVALAEYVGGTQDHFVQLMNDKARALGMRDTLYTDPTGLDDQHGYSSAYDVALLSRYLVMSHPDVLQYTATWEHRLRGGKLWLVNRNKLLTRLPGTDGLKTGFTTGAGYCLAATAKRGATRLISVVLGEPSGAQRFDESAAVLQWGFSNYTTVQVADPAQPVAQVPVDGGVLHTATLIPEAPFGVTVARGREKTVARQVEHPPLLVAPVRPGQRLGEIRVLVEGKPVASVPLVAARPVPRIGPLRLWLRLWSGLWPWLRR